MKDFLCDSIERQVNRDQRLRRFEHLTEARQGRVRKKKARNEETAEGGALRETHKKDVGLIAKRILAQIKLVEIHK